MKAFAPIAGYTAKENTALRFITDAIVNHLHPLVIYCITSVSSTTIERSCFNANKKITEWKFACDLLIVMPNDIPFDENTKTEIGKLTAAFGEVNVRIHPLHYVEQQVKEGNPFFTVVRSEGVVVNGVPIAIGK